MHEDPSSFKQSSSYGLFSCFHYSFSSSYFLIVHLNYDHLVTTFELSHILTNTPKQHIFSFLSELNIFNIKLNLRMARYSLFCDGSAVKHQPTCDYTVTACSAMSLAGFFSACKNLTPAVFIDFSSKTWQT